MRAVRDYFGDVCFMPSHRHKARHGHQGLPTAGTGKGLHPDADLYDPEAGSAFPDFGQKLRILAENI